MKNEWGKIKAELEKTGVSVQSNISMAEHTTFKIGGCAPLLVTVKTEEELMFSLKLFEKYGVNFFILGNGSNLLISDSGIDSAAVKLCGDFLKVEVDGEKISCGAGVSLSKLCTVAYENGLCGLEFAYGIPGTVGGAVYMNAGAYGGEMTEVISSVAHVGTDGEKDIFEAEKLNFSYRHSVYNENECIIMYANFLLKRGNKAEIKEKMNDFMQRRISKQPLDMPSAGSTFKRPSGAFAGTLIEQCGLKGFSIGGAQVSKKHAGFIVNTGGATCEDVKALIAHVQKTVREETGYKLETEIIV